MANPIRRVLEYVLDKNSAKRTEREAQQALDKSTDPKKAGRNLRKVESGFDRLKRAALKLGAAIAAAFALNKIRQFGVEAIRAAVEAEAIWNKLSGTLQTIGVNFADVRGEIEATARALQDATTVGDEDFAQTLQTLIAISRDYEKSLRNVAVVADLSAGANIDLRTAAMLTGRAMVGETALLKRYGIVVGEGEDAVEALRKQFAGMAENEAQSLQGRVAQLNNEWGDFKEAVGDAMIAAGGGTSIIETLIGTVKGMTLWVERNSDTIQEWSKVLGIALGGFRVFFNIIGRGAALFRGTFQGAVALATGAISLLVDGAVLGVRAISRLNDLVGRNEAGARWRGYANDLEMANRALKRFAQNAADVAGENIGDAFRISRAEAQVPGAGGGAGAAAPAAAAGAGGAGAQAARETAEGFARALTTLAPGIIEPAAKVAIADTLRFVAQDSAHELAGAWLDANRGMVFAAQDAALGVMDAWGTAFQRIMEDGKITGDTVAGVFANMGAAALGSMAQMAAGKVAENIANAFESFALSSKLTALGALPLAAAAANAGRGYLVSAAKWGAVGAVSGGAAGAMGGRGGGSGYTPSGFDPVGRQMDRTNTQPPPAIIYIDPFNPANPVHARQAGKALDLDVRLGGTPEWANRSERRAR